MKNGPRILIVEDSLTQAERLKFILESHAYTVAAARNGQEALAALAADPPELVISDIVMPEMDGYAFCHRIKHDERYKNIPVILLTSLNDPIDVIKGLECGADNFIFKPYDEDYLLARVVYMLANRHLRERDTTQMGVEIVFAGRKFFITSDRLQILNLLLSTYEAAVQRNRELASARDELQQLNDVLEARVRERTAALEAEVAERRRSEEEVRRLNAELEQRVQERTARLEAANRELEAFSYSVSHDLRAPLRHISGFVNLLADSAGEALPDQSRRYLDTIARSAHKMGQLIDDLLRFSRMSRAELHVQPVELTTLVQEAVESLEPEYDGRNVVWRCDPLPAVHGDRALLHQVFVNLLSNALKFSRERDPAEIAVGTEAGAPGEVVVYVRDNGVGFDMAYAGKLFGVFQRLHREEEFEGTGIGLANVQRIVARHGGRVWAEGRPGDGATFYLSLPTGASHA